MGKMELSNDESPLISKVPQKSTSAKRWVILILSCVMLLGSYYCFDTPSALKSQIHDYMGDEDFETQFALMYTLYAAPNAIIPLFGGGLVDLEHDPNTGLARDSAQRRRYQHMFYRRTREPAS